MYKKTIKYKGNIKVISRVRKECGKNKQAMTIKNEQGKMEQISVEPIKAKWRMNKPLKEGLKD